MRKIATITVFLLAACGAEVPESPKLPDRWYTEGQVETGRVLYTNHCAVCHGTDATGTADWRSPGADGNYPPPPLDGSAHTWHHPLELLDFTIENGGAGFGGVMPGFGASMSVDQRLSIVAYVQTLWPDDIYSRWEEIDERSR